MIKIRNSKGIWEFNVWRGLKGKVKNAVHHINFGGAAESAFWCDHSAWLIVA